MNGEVISKEGKTYVRITSTYNRTDFLWRIFGVALVILLVPFLILTALMDGVLNLGIFADILISCIVGIALILGHTETREKTGKQTVALMEQEIRNRVHNIERWDD